MEFTLDSWIQNYRQYVDQVLSKIIKNPEARQQFLNQQSMNVFAKAMATQLFDPSFNYEELEKIGDSALNTAFIEYVTSRFPDATASDISELRNRYVSKSELSQISKNLELYKWVLLVPPVDIDGKLYYSPSFTYNILEYVHILEDIFESFIGALFTVGNMGVSKTGQQNRLGYIIVSNFVKSIFDEMNIDMETTEGSNKTQVYEMSHQLTKQYPKQVETVVPGESVTVEVYLNQPLLNILKSEGIRIPALVGSGTGRTKKVAEVMAYKNALQTMKSYGFTQDWIKDYQIKKKWSSEELVPYISQLAEKLRREGFVDFNFFTPKITNIAMSTLIQLQGIKENGKVIPLITTQIPKDNLKEGKVELIRQFLGM